MNFDREETLRQWDYWRKYIAEGGQADGPRIWLETLLDQFDELLAERKALLETIDEWRKSRGIPRKSA